MRKVLSFVLVLSLVLGSLGMAFAAPMSDVQGEDFEDAVNVLAELGVVSGYPDGSYRPDNIVTRAEMAVFVVRALGLADYAVGTANFKDMAGHWSNPYVAYANALGVIAGYPDGTFRPDRTVSYDEAATMLVAALGYNADSLVGTWPANFVVKAKSLGILDGIVAGSAGANRGDIATMVFQTLDKQIGKTNKDGDWTAYNSGTLTDPIFDTMLSRLGAELYLDGAAFVLGLEDAEDAVANVRAYLGAYVTAYQNSDEEIIAIKEVKSVFLDGTYKAGNKFKADGVEYSIEASAISGAGIFCYTTSDAALILKNGGDSSGAATAGNDYVLAAKVSGKKITAIYSISEWGVDHHALFEEGDLDDESLMNYNFKLDDNDDIVSTSFDLVGVNSLSDIEEENVVYIYEGVDSAAKTYITKVEVGTETASGKITKIVDNKKYTIGGKVYEKFAGGPNSELKIDAEVDVWLDVNGKIYKAEKISGKTDKLAVVLTTGERVIIVMGAVFIIKLRVSGTLNKYIS